MIKIKAVINKFISKWLVKYDHLTFKYNNINADLFNSQTKALDVQIRKIIVSLPISVSISTAKLLASTINRYSGSDSTGPIISEDFRIALLYLSISDVTLLTSGESLSLANSLTESTFISVNSVKMELIIVIKM